MSGESARVTGQASGMARMRSAPTWLACYVQLGLVQSGMVPVILALAAPPGPAAGLTYAAFAASGIAAPFIGAWSDRTRKHRRTLAGGLALAGVALMLHALPGGVLQHMVTAMLIGLGVSSASTVATMFIVEVEPEPKWDGRISELQACIGGGQLVGLLVAGMLGLRHVEIAFVLAGALLLLAVPLALAFAPDPVVVVNRDQLPPKPARGGDGVPFGPQRSFHCVSRNALASLSHNGLTWFLAAWLLSYTATNGLSVMFAVAMVRDYHVAATLPTTAYAIGVGFSLLLYRVVGGWDQRFGAWHVMVAALALRAAIVAVMVVLTWLHTDATVLPVLVCFAATQVVWPMLSVASTSLAVTLSPARRAESVGLLNAATSLAATLGGALAGFLLRDGFDWLCGAVLVALLAATLLAWHPKIRFDPA